jgi:hypothetical protein
MTKAQVKQVVNERRAWHFYPKLMDASVPILKPIAATKIKVRLGGVVHALTFLIPVSEWKAYLGSNALPFGGNEADDFWGCWYLHRHGWDLPTIAKLQAWEIDRQVRKLLPR